MSKNKNLFLIALDVSNDTITFKLAKILASYSLFDHQCVAILSY